MTGYDLLNNYIENPEAVLRKKLTHAASSSATPPIDELVNLHHPLLQPWPRRSATTPSSLLPTCPLGRLSTLGIGTSSSAPASL